MMSFEDLNFIFYIWVLNTTIEAIIKKFQSKQYFATTFRPSTKTLMVLVYLEHYFGPLYHAYSQVDLHGTKQ